MAIELATAYVNIASSSKDLGKDVIKQVGDAGDEGGRVGGEKAGKSFTGKLGGFLKKSLIGVGATAGGLLAASLVKGWGRLTNIENATAKLSGLGNSAETVSAVMDNALSSVKGTAFGLDEAATTAAGVVAAGIKPGKDLEGVLKTVADTATIAGKSMADTGAIFGSVAARGKLQGDDLLQLQSAGVPVLAMLAKHYGITAAAASEMVTKGKVDFQNFNAALQENLGGAALKSGETTQGAFKNMWAAASRFGAALAGPAFGGAKKFFVGVTGFVDDLTSKVGPAMTKVQDSVGPLTARALDVGKKAWKGFADTAGPVFKSLTDSAAPGFKKLWDAIVPLAKPLMDVLAALSPIKLIFEAIKPLLPQIGDLIGNLAGSLAGFLGDALKSVTPLLQTIADAVGRLIAVVTPLIASLLPPLNDLFQKLAPLLDAVLAAVLPIVDALTALLIPAIDAIMPVVETVFGAIGPIIDGVMTTFGGLIDFLTGVFSGDWSKAWDGIKQIFSGIWDGIKAVMQGAWDVLKAIWDVIAGVFQSVVLDPLKTAVGWLNDNVIQPIVDAFSTAWDGIKGVWNVVSGWFTENVINPLKTAFDWVNSHAIQPVVNAFKNAVTNIKAAWQGVVGFFKGIVNGVIGGFEWLVNRVIDAVNSVFDLIRENSGIASILPGGGAVAKALQEVSGGFSHVSFPRLEKGGPVTSARPYIVGERGPELFVPSMSGRIVPNHELRGGPVASSMAPLDLSGLESRLDQMAEEYRRHPQRLVTAAQNAGVPLVLMGAR